jgi:putative NAD(P)-binding protein
VAGKVARRLSSQLVQHGHQADRLHRKPEQAEDLAARGATPVAGDLTKLSAAELAELMKGSDAIVFSAGAGGTSMEVTNAIDGRGLELWQRPRDDVAATLVEIIGRRQVSRVIIELTDGGMPIGEAQARIASRWSASPSKKRKKTNHAIERRKLGKIDVSVSAAINVGSGARSLSNLPARGSRGRGCARFGLRSCALLPHFFCNRD